LRRFHVPGPCRAFGKVFLTVLNPALAGDAPSRRMPQDHVPPTANGVLIGLSRLLPI